MIVLTWSDEFGVFYKIQVNDEFMHGLLANSG